MISREGRRSTRRQLLEGGSSIKRTSIEHYVCVTHGFKKDSYGEIRFKGHGSRSTYAPFVTCTPTATPESVWRLMTRQWCLPVPNVIISILGNFARKDYTWLNVMKESWLITTGSSPCHQTSNNSYTIAIIEIDTVDKKELLYSRSNKGLFPAVYRAAKSKKDKNALDSTHTHFIFVEGGVLATATFRDNLIAYIASIPIEMDAAATSYSTKIRNVQRRNPLLEAGVVTIPVITALVSEDAHALLDLSKAVQQGYPVTVTQNASKVMERLEDTSIRLFTTTDVERIIRKSKMSFVIDRDDKEKICESLNLLINSRKKVTLHPSPNYRTIKKALLRSIVTSEKCSFRSKIRVSMIWDCMDVLKTLFYSRRQFEGEEDYITLYLVMALSLDRAQFLEYLQELGVNVYSQLTVKTLWHLYFESLYNVQFETETSFIVRMFVDEFVTEDASNLLYCVGRCVERLTKFEVYSLYEGEFYKHYSCRRKRRKPSAIALTHHSADDDSPIVHHPERDLFIWCILFGKSQLASLFWKNGNSYAASALIASSIVKGQAEVIDSRSHDSAIVDVLTENSKFWVNQSINFISASYKARRGATLCQLTQRLVHFGDCSMLQLAFATEMKEFLAQPPSQSALDYIWMGKAKADLPFWKKILALVCPFSIPCLNLIDRTNHFVPTVTQAYQSVFTEEDDDDDVDDIDEESGIAGVANFIRNVTDGAASLSVTTTPKKRICYIFRYFQEIFDYMNSPSAKFLLHSIFLVAGIILMSIVLIMYDPVRQTSGSHWTYQNNIPSLLLSLYMLGLTVDEVRQILSDDQVSVFTRFRKWFSDAWNKMDLLMIVCYFTAQVLYLSGNVSTFVPRVLLSVALIAMYVRCFQIYMVVPFLGPKIFMMSKMIKDLLTFLSIMALVFFCYGAIVASIKYDMGDIKDFHNISNFDDVVLNIYNYILREPYWQIYGNALGNAAEPLNDLQQLVLTLATALYLLFSNILMVNLLIAMFSYTFQNIQDNAHIYWRFHRYEVVREFWDRPWLPSPFIIIEDALRLGQWIRNSAPRSQAFKRFISTEQEGVLREFEKEIQAQMIEDEVTKKESKHQLQDDIKRILAKLDQMHSNDSE